MSTVATGAAAGSTTDVGCAADTGDKAATGGVEVSTTIEDAAVFARGTSVVSTALGTLEVSIVFYHKQKMYSVRA